VEATPDDAALVEEARRGNASALEALLRMHQTVAYRTAYAITRSPEDAEDVVQSAFLKAARSLHRFRAGSPFRPWLLTIVGNEARNLRRTVLRRLRLLERAAREAPAPAQSAGSSAVADEERRRLLAAVEGLPPDDRPPVAASTGATQARRPASQPTCSPRGTAPRSSWPPQTRAIVTRSTTSSSQPPSDSSAG
jgi:RNA polymerase sigma-70 factor (ECF subfamily)